MILKGQIISFDKQTMPLYIIKFNAAMLAFFVGWFVLCLPAMITVGVIYDEAPVTYIVMGCLFGVFLFGVLILCIVALKLRERLVAERAAELEDKFSEMPLDEAEENLKQRGVINENGFVCTRGDIFGEKTVPFDKAEILVYGAGGVFGVEGHRIVFKAHPLYVDVYADLYDGVDFGEACQTYKLDRALFNFLDKRNLVNNEDNRDFFYLKTNKKNFCRRAFGFRVK